MTRGRQKKAVQVGIPSTAPKPAPAAGLECRSCGCQHFYVLETRAAHGGRILRRRECRHCGRRLTTYEIPAEPGAKHYG